MTLTKHFPVGIALWMGCSVALANVEPGGFDPSFWSASKMNENSHPDWVATPHALAEPTPSVISLALSDNPRQGALESTEILPTEDATFRNHEIYLKGGILGAGAGYAYGVNERFTLRGDVSTMGKYSFTKDIDDITYAGNVRNNMATLYADWFPFADSGFRLTAGVGFRDMKISTEGRMSDRVIGTTTVPITIDQTIQVPVQVSPMVNVPVTTTQMIDVPVTSSVPGVLSASQVAQAATALGLTPAQVNAMTLDQLAKAAGISLPPVISTTITQQPQTVTTIQQQSVTNTVMQTQTVKVQSTIKAPVTVGPNDKVDAQIRWPTIAPYLGVGWGHNIGQHAKAGWGFVADIGAYFGNPTVTYEISAQTMARFDAISNGGGQAEIDRQKALIQKQVDQYRIMPVAYLGVSYRW